MSNSVEAYEPVPKEFREQGYEKSDLHTITVRSTKNERDNGLDKIQDMKDEGFVIVHQISEYAAVMARPQKDVDADRAARKEEWEQAYRRPAIKTLADGVEKGGGEIEIKEQEFEEVSSEKFMEGVGEAIETRKKKEAKDKASAGD